ncbi:acetyl-CoA carboxylase biotin carboxyl carrier protein [uncultured Victivallis sp.]|uniref:acetyl-CoA carboxylase biotin carboxyl carrier protein n=1 Tax=Victivallis sp. TaxID=2049020 RepID=UPI0025EEEA49|nr:acetyl-CoA carboxylase biotin carboxyl carrier protein [uncultured Victivallis sp.]
MKIEEIKTIVKLMSDHDLTEFKIEAEAYNLCIRRGSGAAAPAPVMVAAAPAPVQMAAPVAAAAPAPAAPAAAPAPAAPVSVETIDAPLVGTFYRAASPEAQAFVKVGDHIAPDTVIGIIEAMKVMNEIKAEKSGVIKEVLVENGQPVEFGQPLFVIE